MLHAVGAALWLLRFRQVHDLLGRAAPVRGLSDRDSTEARASISELTRMVDMAARHTLWSNTCLHRSMTLWWLLRRRGFDAQLRLGTRRLEDRFHAHAWVEYAGMVVNDAEASQHAYEPLTGVVPDSTNPSRSRA
jgi:hypothetical protein